ncbi:Fc.00g072130.m01.CDS01 [Cosmosporella sp. VM-42]
MSCKVVSDPAIAKVDIAFVGSSEQYGAEASENTMDAWVETMLTSAIPEARLILLTYELDPDDF